MEKLLVVDDDEALRRLMRLELSDTYEVIDSGEPEQGLALALEHRPGAILLDLRMPKYSGYELLQTFTSFSRTQMIPVIIVSGEAGGQTKEHCKQLGAADYIEKPIDFSRIGRLIVPAGDRPTFGLSAEHGLAFPRSLDRDAIENIRVEPDQMSIA